MRHIQTEAEVIIKQYDCLHETVVNLRDLHQYDLSDIFPPRIGINLWPT